MTSPGIGLFGVVNPKKLCHNYIMNNSNTASPLSHVMAEPNFRVDKILNWGKNRAVAWFAEVGDADAYVTEKATDPLNTAFDFKIVDLANEA